MERKKETLTVSAVAENMKKVTEFVNGYLEQWNCPAWTRIQIDIAIDELFGNIARYAYKGLPGETVVEVEVAGEPPAAVITFIDRGVPFDPLKKAEPDISSPGEERKPGGLGIYIVRQSMDEVFYRNESGKNVLQIRKNFQEEKDYGNSGTVCRTADRPTDRGAAAGGSGCEPAACGLHGGFYQEGGI